MRSVSQIELVWELYQANVRPKRISSKVGKHRTTIYRWIKNIKLYGIKAFLRKYKTAKQRKRIKRIDYRAEGLIIERRKDKEECGQKIRWWLDKFHGIIVSVAQIYRILGKHFKLHGKCTKWTRRPPLPKAIGSREVIQADTVDLGELFAFNFIDTFTKEAITVIRGDQTAESGAYALEKAFSFFEGTIWLQTDNGSEYKSIFRRNAKRYCQHLRQITPYQKEENGFVESFNRTFRKECAGWRYYKLKEKDQLQSYVNKWLDEYHMERPHLSLNLLTPQEFVNSLNERRQIAII